MRRIERYRRGLVCIALLFVWGCDSDAERAPTRFDDLVEQTPHPLGAHLFEHYRGGLERIRHDRYLRVLTSRNSFDYYIQNGEPGGYQLEMVRAFVAALNEKYPPAQGQPEIQFEILPVARDQMVQRLLGGGGDLIAARMIVTERHADGVRFSVPYQKVREEVLTSLDPTPFRRREDLAGRQFVVRRNSTYYDSVVALNRWLAGKGLEPVEIVFVPDDLEAEEILERVGAGEFEFALTDSILAAIAPEVFDGVSAVGITLRDGRGLAWATDERSVGLLREIDDFLPRYGQGSLLGNLAVRKHFLDSEEVSRRIGADGSPALSPYDEWFREYSAEYGFDWRLIAAVAYQESRFDQTAVSASGATGLFQLKPETAEEDYIAIDEIDGEPNAENNIHAGVKYLAWIRDRYFQPLAEMSERNRLRMTLAAYNAGPASLLAAREHAAEMELDPDRWFRNVELALLDAQKSEPVDYVSEVNKRYLSYVLLGVEK